jgi:hypothetical protein
VNSEQSWQLSRRGFAAVALSGVIATTGSKEGMARERVISWPTPGGIQPKCMQYPGPYCEGIVDRFRIGKREFLAPGPYRGMYVAETPEIIRKFNDGFCAFLYPSGNSIAADRWTDSKFEIPDNELTAILIWRWQYLDEYDQSFRIPPRDEGSLNITPGHPSPPLIDQAIRTERGGFRRHTQPHIVDHDRGIFAQVVFDYEHRNEVRKIWDMFLNFENEWRVK